MIIKNKKAAFLIAPLLVISSLFIAFGINNHKSKYLHIYGKVDPKVGIRNVGTINCTDDRECPKCCDYDGFFYGGYLARLEKKLLGDMKIDKDGNYSMLIPIDLKDEKDGCKWYWKYIGIDFFYNGDSTLSSLQINFVTKEEVNELVKKNYPIPLKKIINLEVEITYLKNWGGENRGKVSPTVEFVDPGKSRALNLKYFTIFPQDNETVELEMNITTIKYLNTVEDAKKQQI